MAKCCSAFTTYVGSEEENSVLSLHRVRRGNHRTFSIMNLFLMSEIILFALPIVFEAD